MHFIMLNREEFLELDSLVVAGRMLTYLESIGENHRFGVCSHSQRLSMLELWHNYKLRRYASTRVGSHV